ncbi:unnamed protein product [Cercopithifilaria johnstoni]|uniref:Uncharacterized protein n=1 Tax=Cercopithifilaria johnstoni TaxID=2874296 RepID=A0A8J2M626_9BILA|nr:unnamed protein product [Cercopithifilaria johnstoni]
MSNDQIDKEKSKVLTARIAFDYDNNNSDDDDDRDNNDDNDNYDVEEAVGRRVAALSCGGDATETTS